MATSADSPSRPLRSGLLCTVLPIDGAARSAALHVRGSLDACTAADHAAQLGELLDDGYIDLRIELDDLVLCTSDGLDLWDDVQHRLDPVGGHVTLTGATGVVRRVLDVMTTSPVHFCPTVVAAA